MRCPTIRLYDVETCDAGRDEVARNLRDEERLDNGRINELGMASVEAFSSSSSEDSGSQNLNTGETSMSTRDVSSQDNQMRKQTYVER